MTEKIILGNCVNVLPTLKNNCVDSVFTSPPYNRKRNDTYEKFNDMNNDYLELLKTVTKESLRIAKNNVIINVQSNMYNKKDLLKWQVDFVDNYKGCVIWVKKNPTPSWNYKKEKDVYSITNAYEYFYVFGKDDTSFEANNKIFNVLISDVNSKHFNGHGAVMRLDIAEWFICNFTKQGDFVFDPFFGCGTTGIACIKNNRKWGGVEIIPEYKKMAEQRIQEEIEQASLFGHEEITASFNPYKQFSLSC
jgi:DNA modification methylase